ncbi:hypothetical protein HA402_006502 [Bradysia odoriphaga]|nr:hypothetical protein HA402_006502 [Bradysia odoriphaga]
MALPKQTDITMKEDDDDEFDDNNSISEHISVESNIESDSVQQSVNIKKRQLFGMDKSDKDDDLLDDLLTGENIAKHFAVNDEEDKRGARKEDIDESSDIKPSISEQQEQLVESISKLKDLSERKIQIKIHRDANDDEVSSVNVKLDVRERSSNVDLMKSPSQKEISPLQEDVILINNEKVSIDSLKNLVQDDHSFNTTNDVSEIGADDNSLSGLLSEGKHESSKENILDEPAVQEGDASALAESEASNDPLKSDESFEEDHSVEEIVVSNASVNLDSNTKMNVPKMETPNAEAYSDSNANKIPLITQIVEQTIDELPSGVFEDKNDPDSLDSLSAEMDRILQDTIDDIPAEVFGDKVNTKSKEQVDVVETVNEPDSLENMSENVFNIISDTINKLPIEKEDPSSKFIIRDEISQILTKTVNDLPIAESDSIEYSDGIADIKEKIKEKTLTVDPPKPKTHQQIIEEIEIEDFPPVVIKTMEKCNYVKEMLDDITEESDISLEPKVNVLTTIPQLSTVSNEIKDKGSEMRKIIEANYLNEMFFPVSPYLADFVQNEQQSNSFDSVVSLNMLQLMESKVKELEEIVASKDVCLAALNMQLDSRRNSIKDVIPSARDSYSLATVSTEYRTYQDEYVNRAFDFNIELAERDQIIETLTASLQQNIRMNEQLRIQGDKLMTEVMQLRKQVSETGEFVRRTQWMRDQGGSQRLSEISIDLVESDDNLDEKNFTDIEEKSYCTSTERQSVDGAGYDSFEPLPISKQIEQFQKYLSQDELRIFFMVQSKFHDFLSQEVEKVKNRHDAEMKILNDQLETEKHEKNVEINRLQQLLTNVKSGSTELEDLRKELDEVHAREMEDLRTYFEQKCTDMEKQYSEEVFSQHSRRHSNESGSELSDQEQLIDDHISNIQPTSPKRKSKDLLASPTHRKITPTSIGDLLSPLRKIDVQNEDQDPEPTVDEIHAFYKDKIAELNRNYDDTTRRLRLRLKRFENRSADDEYMVSFVYCPLVLCLGWLSPDDDSTDDTNNDSQALRKIVEEYEERLEQQIALARVDMVQAFEEQIKALLSETATDDSQWPPELILLREKFTAKSQLEIAQLQIRHKEEMDRLKNEYDKQFNRKQKRQSTFDTNRDLEQIVHERDNLRELCSSFRWLLSELAKCVSTCETDISLSLVDQLQKLGIEGIETKCLDGKFKQSDDLLNASIESGQSFSTKGKRFTPDVSGILNLVDDPMLVSFVLQSKDASFDLNECVERLKQEANQLLKITEILCKRDGSEKNDSCEEEDGLKCQSSKKVHKLEQTVSLNENLINGRGEVEHSHRGSLPINLFEGASSEFMVQLNELKNRLLVSENEKKSLATELADTQRKNDELAQILCIAKEHLEQLETQNEDISEGFGISQLQSPSRQRPDNKSSYSVLQNAARSLFNEAITNSTSDGSALTQQFEDFVSDFDKFVEEEKKKKNDLQEQIDAAYKHKKATSKLLEQQALEWQQERDDFTKEIDRLNAQIRDKEKELHTYCLVAKEVEVMEQQIKEMTLSISDYEDKKQQLENDLKASIDKIFVLREIIAELEKQVETKSANENAMTEKIKSLETYANAQSHTNESLHDEMESLKTEMVTNYRERISSLEEQLQNARPSAEQSMLIEQISSQLKEIEISLDRKTKNLESLHSAIYSASCSSPSEDVSVKGLISATDSPIDTPRTPHSLPVDDVQRILEKLVKHNRAEEAAVKRIRDLEMQIGSIRSSYLELQQERDNLQEKMTEQILRISTLQSRLDEQRHRAEELNRQSTSDLNIKVYDLQSKLNNVEEKLVAREKQIATLKDHLEQSKVIIDRLEADLAKGGGGEEKIGKLEMDLQAKSDENRKLKEKISSEMINKLALPDLMETMMADKDEELDQLKEQLAEKQKELQVYLSLNLDANQLDILKKHCKEASDGKMSARTLSDIISLTEYDEPDVVRKTVDSTTVQFSNMDSTIAVPAKMSIVEPSPIMYDAYGDSIPSPKPRKLNFTDDSSSASRPNETIVVAPDGSTLPKIDETRVDELQAEIARLQEKLSAMLVLEDEVESLKMSLESTDDASNLSLDLQAKNKLLNELIAEKKQLQVEFDEIKFKLNKLANIQTEMDNLNEQLKERDDDITALHDKLDQKGRECEELLSKIDKLKTTSVLNEQLMEQIDVYGQQIQSLSKTLSHKDELLTKHDKELLNYSENEIRYLDKIRALEDQVLTLSTDQNLLKKELEATRNDLYEKMIDYEHNKLELNQRDEKIEELKDILSDSKSPRSVEDMRIEIRREQEKNVKLQNEIDRLKVALNRQENSSSPKPLSLDEIAERVEKELNYSAQLDDNILKAIESDEINSDDENFERSGQPTTDVVLTELNDLKRDLNLERNNCSKLQGLLDKEKKNSEAIQQHDAEIIDTMRLRLQAALEHETELQKILDIERAKGERLTSQLLVYQRTTSRENSLILKSPPDSPRRTQRSDADSELAIRLQSEIKLLTAQNDRERERVNDIERVMEREKHRFEKELMDRKEYGEQMKREMDRVLKEKEQLALDLEHAQERLILSSREIESLEQRLANLQEVESRRAALRGRERQESTQNAVDVHELKAKLSAVERERDSLIDKVSVLRGDIERSARREAQLTDALVKEQSGDGIVPKQFLQKLNNMNSLIVDNTKENRQMGETLQILTEERRALQQRVADLEMRNRAFNREELEERAQHLFGKYLRVESFRKALVHQKRYLVLVLQTYQENEAKAMNMLHGQYAAKKPKSFKAAVLVVIAIERMKYIVRRWHTGKRLATKAVFTNSVPRRSASATLSFNNWSRPENPQSPPSRDTRQSFPSISRSPMMSPMRPLQSPNIIAECSERLEKQWH